MLIKLPFNCTAATRRRANTDEVSRSRGAHSSFSLLRCCPIASTQLKIAHVEAHESWLSAGILFVSVGLVFRVFLVKFKNLALSAAWYTKTRKENHINIICAERSLNSLSNGIRNYGVTFVNRERRANHRAASKLKLRELSDMWWWRLVAETRLMLAIPTPISSILNINSVSSLIILFREYFFNWNVFIVFIVTKAGVRYLLQQTQCWMRPGQIWKYLRPTFACDAVRPFYFWGCYLAKTYNLNRFKWIPFAVFSALFLIF